MKKNTAVIIGGGPAGLTTAYELLNRTNIIPIVLEMSSDIGGISKTVNYKGNRIDIGGHRFFSKSKRVMDWWKNIMPIQEMPARDDLLLGREHSFSVNSSAKDPEKIDKIMLIRNRLSRIFFMRSFFDYPISLKWDTFKNLGFLKILKIGVSYIYYKIFPYKDEKSLEEFLINRFGKELYNLFFKDYTEKVWGVSCDKIKPEWGAQRIKGLSITKALFHALKSSFIRDSSLEQSKTETSLIDKFMYPKFGPGQLWEEVAREIVEKGGEVRLQSKAVKINLAKDEVTSVEIENSITNESDKIECNYVFSTMPVKELINSISPNPPSKVINIANGLVYRDFITVGVLLGKMKINNETEIPTINDIIPDNWIYIQERDVKLGRLQIFNNWSPYLVDNPDTVWIGLEYFCNEGDELWEKSNSDFMEFAIHELHKIDIIDKNDVIDSTIIRMPKTYPAYFGTYGDFHHIRNYTDKIDNLFLVGRNGMHKYNNADHSMLTAMTAVDNIVNQISTKENIWEINTEQDYHESKEKE